MGRKYAIIPAGGIGNRSGLNQPKQFFEWQGEPVLSRSVRLFVGLVDAIVVAAPEEWLDQTVQLVGKQAHVVVGGATRFESVHNAFQALPTHEPNDLIAIHDAARPFFNAQLLNLGFNLCREKGAVLFARKATDTIKWADALGVVEQTLDRNRIWLAQTPQIFSGQLLQKGYKQFQSLEPTFTDEAAMVEAMGHPVHLLEGNIQNRKLTEKEDFMRSGETCIGHGYDVHRFDPSRPLYLCGVEIPGGPGLLGHSDADVALHAIMDALLGATGQGDIGHWFPDNDPQYKGVRSTQLFAAVWQDLSQKGYQLGNVDLTIQAQIPKLAPYRDLMRKQLAELFQVSPQKCNVKATTTEGLGFVGEKLGMAAHAVVCLVRESCP
ncbi:MAG: 2-C-methyl-D-erythritol 2,4-cyclodiphosphate synthase [Acidobacteria bacterium]|nr:2-C-methyl-D-erythritol 2,4-cyclodiphosphate synthase [Acidobacteriota bacterium]